ncbi:TSUP family transporter [Aquabacter sp. CN5-332]|uniref:TSUP family transporter n=1 Tax=Aquabacter sp. CN5-332 TaxID=3156608 RepID=UPI0032B3EB9A
MFTDGVILLAILFGVIAALYAAVGQAGASGYLAVMALFGVAPAVMKPTALALNLLVAAIGTIQARRMGLFSWRTFYPFAVLGFPFSLIGGAVHLPANIYYSAVGEILLLSAAQMLRMARGASERPSATPAEPPFHELPPNGQGIATLMTLGMLDALGVGTAPVETTHLVIEATKLALADLDEFVGDPDTMSIDPRSLLDPAYLAERAKEVDPGKAGLPSFKGPKPGGTVYLSAADAQGRMVSFIQSNYMGFGSGVVVPGTGISLQNRGTSFSLKPGHANQVGPRKRPFHTIIPGFAMDAAGAPLMSFGVMGGPMQAQGHTQMVLRTLKYRQGPQAAADAPRWRVVSGRKVAVEPSVGPELLEGLKALGHEIVVEPPEAVFAFGGAQLILRGEDGAYVGGSDSRKDGQVAAF